MPCVKYTIICLCVAALQIQLGMHFSRVHRLKVGYYCDYFKLLSDEHEINFIINN